MDGRLPARERASPGPDVQRLRATPRASSPLRPAKALGSRSTPSTQDSAAKVEVLAMPP